MAAKHHALSASDAATMTATRAYLATLPRLPLVPDTRSYYDDFMTMTPAAEGVSFEPATIAGLAGWWCLPLNAPADAALLHLHGGGYVMGSALAYRNFVSHFAKEAGVATFVPDYPLAPEAPFPAGIDQTVALVDALQAAGRKRLLISGDSAGGGLALAVAQARSAVLRGVLLISPWADLTLTSASVGGRAEADPILTPDALAGAVALYAGAVDPRDPRVSPRFGSFAGLPPLMIHTGTDEILHDDATALEAAAESAGTAVALHLWDGMTHGFPISLATLGSGPINRLETTRPA